MQFKLILTLGNDAMVSTADVAAALEKLASRLGAASYPLDKTMGPHSVQDVNGNTVGYWEVQEET